MAANSQGIATLLDAEKEASQIVAKAREYRTQRLKDARGEANKEIEQLRAKKDDEFRQFEDQTEVDKSTKAALEKIESSFEANNAQVVQQLLDRVVQVQPRLHRNLEARS